MRFKSGITLLIKIFMIFIVLMNFVGCHSGKQASPDSYNFQTDSTEVKLDEEAYKKNLAAYFSKVANKNNKSKFIGIHIEPQGFRIEELQPLQLGENSYFVTKVSLVDGYNYGLEKQFPLKAVTDPTGRLLFTQVFDLKERKEPFFSRAPKVTQLTLPESVKRTVVMTGPGTRDVLFISDPFCSYCRKGYAYLSRNMNHIRKVEVIHNPLFPQIGSAVASWVIEYAKANNYKPSEVFGFTYSRLNPVQPQIVNGKKTSLPPELVAFGIIKQYVAAFPGLFKGADEQEVYSRLIAEHSKEVADTRDQLQRAGFSSTPVFSIDGKILRGVNTKRLDELLGIKQDKRKAKESAEAELGICEQGCES